MINSNKNEPLFVNHTLNFNAIEWAMAPEQIKSLMNSTLTCYGQNSEALGFFGKDQLNFDGNLYDAYLLFFFEKNKLHKISIMLDVIFDNNAEVYYIEVKNYLSSLYGKPTKQGSDPISVSDSWKTKHSKITLSMTKEPYPFPKERTMFGFNPHHSSEQLDHYYKHPDIRLRIIFEYKK